MSQKLKDRIDSYRELSEHKLLNRVPIIICINGKSFSKMTSLLEKPYCNKFAEGMWSATLKMCMEIEGAVFGYQYNDEIVIVARNDQNLETEPWYDNRIQKIASVTASIATLSLKTHFTNSDLNLVGEPICATQIFAVPNVMEAVNTIVYKQQQNFHTSIQFACFYELLKNYDKNTIREMLSGLSVDEKIDLLRQECNIDFNSYPLSFKRGVACYKVPKVTSDGTMKNKWMIDTELPIFTKERSFLTNIFKNGADIFRQGSF
jgi:tRNA(His) guanylyltransferase